MKKKINKQEKHTHTLKNNKILTFFIKKTKPREKKQVEHRSTYSKYRICSKLTHKKQNNIINMWQTKKASNFWQIEAVINKLCKVTETLYHEKWQSKCLRSSNGYFKY